MEVETAIMIRAEDEASATIAAMGQTIRDELVSILNDLVDAVKELSGLFREWIDLNSGLDNDLLGLSGSLGVLSGALSAMFPVVGLVIGIIQALITVGVLLYQNWDMICAKAKEIWNAIVEFFTGVWESIKTTAEEVWNTIVDFFTGIWDNIKTTVEEVWNGIVEFFTGLWDGIRTTVEEVWNGIVEFFTGIWDSIWTTIENVWNGIVDFFAGIWESITQTAEDWWNKFTEWLGKMNPWKWIEEGWSALKDGIGGILSGIFGHSDVENWVSGLSDYLRNVDLGPEGQSMFGSLGEGASEQMEKLNDLMSTLFGKDALETAEETPGGLAGMIATMCENIVTYFKDMWQQVLDITTEFYDALLTFLFPEKVGLVDIIERNWTQLIKVVANIWKRVTAVTAEWWKEFDRWLSTLDPFHFLEIKLNILEQRLRALFEGLVEFQKQISEAEEAAKETLSSNNGLAASSSNSVNNSSQAVKTNTNVTIPINIDSSPIAEKVIRIVGDKIYEQGMTI